MAKRQVVYEEVIFSSYQDAVNTKQNAEQQIEQINKTKTLALISTGCFVVSLLGFLSGICISVSLVLAIICYAKVKCFSGAFKWGLNWAKWGWYLCPFFPADLIVAAVCLFLGAYCFFFVPALALRGIRKKAEEDIFYAEEYINEHKTEQNAVESNSTI